jgi:hypothetical protein
LASFLICHQPDFFFSFLLLVSLNICFRSPIIFSTGRRGLHLLMTRGCITHWHGGNRWTMANSLHATESFWLQFLSFCKGLSLANLLPFIHEKLYDSLIAWNYYMDRYMSKKKKKKKKKLDSFSCYSNQINTCTELI